MLSHEQVDHRFFEIQVAPPPPPRRRAMFTMDRHFVLPCAVRPPGPDPWMLDLGGWGALCSVQVKSAKRWAVGRCCAWECPHESSFGTISPALGRASPRSALVLRITPKTTLSPALQPPPLPLVPEVWEGFQGMAAPVTRGTTVLPKYQYPPRAGKRCGPLPLEKKKAELSEAARAGGMLLCVMRCS